jgi:hypothetical protein
MPGYGGGYGQPSWYEQGRATQQGFRPGDGYRQQNNSYYRGGGGYEQVDEIVEESVIPIKGAQ